MSLRSFQQSCAALAIVSFIAMSTALTVQADDRDAFEARTYANANGQKLPYRLLKPAKFDPSQKYPLVVFLHGAGERGDDNKVQLVHGMADFASPANREKYPAVVIAPQCPKNEKWVDVDWGTLKHDMPEKPASPMRLTHELMAALEKEFPIDADRIYITGLSMGGYGTWDALQRHPHRFAAAIPICGGGDPKFADQIKHIPIWAFHGTQDTAVKPERSRAMIDAIKAAGGTPKYTEYPEAGHDSWSATYKNPDVHAWLFAQRRPSKASEKK